MLVTRVQENDPQTRQWSLDQGWAPQSFLETRLHTSRGLQWAFCAPISVAATNYILSTIIIPQGKRESFLSYKQF